MLYKCSKTGVTYGIAKCCESDILDHYKYVAEYTTDVKPEKYKEEMLKAVSDTGISYKYKGSDGSFGFLYTYIDNSSSGIAVSIFNKGSLIGFIAMLVNMFQNYPKRSILVQPHKNNVALYYSMVEGYSIRDWHNHNTPLVIMINKNLVKFKKIYAKLGLTTEVVV